MVRRHGLTLREWDYANAVHEGLTASAIGEKLFVCNKTVKWQINSLYKKLGCEARVRPELIRRIAELKAL